MTKIRIFLLLLAGLFLLAHPVYAINGIDGVVCGVPTTEKVVALTFDDGPHPTFTPPLLQPPAQYRVVEQGADSSGD